MRVINFFYFDWDTVKFKHLCWLVTNGMIYGKECYWTGIWRFRWCMFGLSWDWCPWNTLGISKTKEDTDMENTFVIAIKRQVFPACWCWHQVLCMAGQMGEKRLQDMTPSYTPVAQKLPVMLRSGNSSEHVCLPGGRTQPLCCHAAQWLFWA